MLLSPVTQACHDVAGRNRAARLATALKLGGLANFPVWTALGRQRTVPSHRLSGSPADRPAEIPELFLLILLSSIHWGWVALD